MNITEAKQQVKDTVEAYLEVDETGLPRIAPVHQRPLFLLGAPGIGKTAIMEQVAQELGIGLVSYSMTHHTRQSALGLPAIVTCDYDGFEYEASEYTMSEIIASIYDYMKETGITEGILFLDEINCVSETLYPSMLQFLQCKTFGRHAVPEGWIVVCAGNPPEYNRSVHEFDIVTLDRLRKIEIEPDYSAWKMYAQNMNTHPAIVTFLDVKNDCFYSVQSTPAGKSFVTARSWSDLSEIMSLFEELDKPVNASLFKQFLQDDEIAERFASYYELFNKYKSDYQIDTILDGTVDEEVFERAQAAEFDENIALISLILDAITQEMGRVMNEEAAMVMVRDELRDIKDQVLAGESLFDLLSEQVGIWEKQVVKTLKNQTMPLSQIRTYKRAIEIARLLLHACETSQVKGGPEAFEVANANFQEIVAALQSSVAIIETQLKNIFDFLSKAYGEDRELLVFTAELTARDISSQYLNRFGSDSYYAHNDVLLLDSHEHKLHNRIHDMNMQKDMHAKLSKVGADNKKDKKAGAESKPKHMKQPESAQPRTMSVPVVEEYEAIEEERPQEHADAVAHEAPADVPLASEDAAAPEASEAPLTTAPAPQVIEVDVPDDVVDYYAGAAFEFGLPSLCKMTLPDDMSDMTVVDIGCRRGRGVFKLSDRVGANGKVIGIDWVDDYVGEGSAKMDRAWKDNGLEQNNMEFYKAYPEYLSMAPIPDDSVDIIYVNSVSNLFYDRETAYQEMYRILKPGGSIVNETVLASGIRDEQVVSEAIALGNSVQAAPDKSEYEDMLALVGFNSISYDNAEPVSPSKGALYNRPVEVVQTDENVAFSAVVATITK